MRTMRVFSLFFAVAFMGCSKNPGKPIASDPYSPMYGTWEGQMSMVSSGGYFSVPDSVRLVVTPTGAKPAFHLWQRKLEPASDPWPWREIPFRPTQVSGCPCAEREWDGVVEASSAPDTVSDPVRGLLGFGWPEGTWHTQFWPNAPRVGPVTKLVVWRSYSGLDYYGYDTGYVELERR
jgi:hypothetical protein